MTEFSSPKVFISYSWDSDSHKTWVKNLATRLRSDGIDVTLDCWGIVPGEQIPEFMESSVRNNDFVLIICTPKYKSRSDNRIGGVGYEGDIITGEVFIQGNDKKFIPLLRESEWQLSSPSSLLGKYYLDFRGENYSEKSYEELREYLLGQREKNPPLGNPYSEVPPIKLLIVRNAKDDKDFAIWLSLQLINRGYISINLPIHRAHINIYSFTFYVIIHLNI